MRALALEARQRLLRMPRLLLRLGRVPGALKLALNLGLVRGELTELCGDGTKGDCLR